MRRGKLILSLLANLWLMLLTHLPGEAGTILRYRYWKKRLRHLGEGVVIDTGVYFQNPGFIGIGDNCWIDKGVMLLGGLDVSHRNKVMVENGRYRGERGVVSIGNNVHIGPYCTISGIAAGVFVSDNCGISSGSRIYAFSHHYRSREDPGNTRIKFSPLVPHDEQCLIEGPVHLGVNSGIALNCVVLPGAAIGDDSFVAIGSVVFGGSYEDNALLAGNPAKRVGARYQPRS